MMTESEFKLYMTSYLDKRLTLVKYQIKELENRLRRMESLLNGKISPAFPYVNSAAGEQQQTDEAKTVTNNTPAADQESCSETLSEEESMAIMDFLKAIHTDVTLIKHYVVECKPSLEKFSF